MDFGFSAGIAALVNLVGVPPNLKVVSLFNLGSSLAVSFSSGSFRVDCGRMDLFSSAFFSACSAFAALAAAAAAANLWCSGLIAASAVAGLGVTA